MKQCGRFYKNLLKSSNTLKILIVFYFIERIRNRVEHKLHVTLPSLIRQNHNIQYFNQTLDTTVTSDRWMMMIMKGGRKQFDYVDITAYTRNTEWQEYNCKTYEEDFLKFCV